MDRVAEAAGVSKRTVYDHFPSKDHLFQAIVDEILNRVDEMAVHEYSKEKPLDEQLLAIGNTFAETITGREFMNANPYYLAKMVMRVGEVLNATLRAGFSLHHFCSKSSRIPNIARREQTP